MQYGKNIFNECCKYSIMENISLLKFRIFCYGKNVLISNVQNGSTFLFYLKHFNT